MSLASPGHLLALLALPLIAGAWAVSHRRRRRFAVRHPGAALYARAITRRPSWRTILPVTLLGLCAVALGTAYANPQHTVRVPVQKASVELVTDESGSMLADDVAPSRLSAVQGAARTFLAHSPSKLLVGFAGFSTSVESNVAPTTDRTAVDRAIDQLHAEGGTATGDALGTALDQLAARKGDDGTTAPSAIVLLSDGARTAGSDPLVAAARARRLKIPVYTVALGTDNGMVQIPSGQLIRVPPDPQTLAQIAARSGGKSYTVADADTLNGVYRELGSKIGTRSVTRPATTPFLVAGLVLLLAGVGTGTRLRSRLA